MAGFTIVEKVVMMTEIVYKQMKNIVFFFGAQHILM
jgi:hypothetical protein